MGWHFSVSIRHEVIGSARQCLYWGFRFLLQCELQENRGHRKVRLSFYSSPAPPLSAPNMSQSNDTKKRLSCCDFTSVCTRFAP